MAREKVKPHVVQNQGLPDGCGFARPLGVGKIIEGHDAAASEVRADGTEGRECGLEEIEVEVCERDDRLRICLKVCRQRVMDIALDEERSVDVAERFVRLVCGEYVAKVRDVLAGQGELAWLCRASEFVDACDVEEALEGVEADDAAMSVVRLMHALSAVVIASGGLCELRTP